MITSLYAFWKKATECRIGANIRVQDPAILLQHESTIGGRKFLTVFLDARKAFDRLPHEILISKMTALGIPSSLVHWTRHFLTGRSFQVKIGSETSMSHPALAGAPKGPL
jgi:hypothetical protein